MAAIWLLRVDSFICCALSYFYFMGDILLRIISHRYLLVLTVLIFLALILQHQKTNLVAAGSVLLVGFFLFAGIIGGGDVKLLTVLSLAIDEHELANFLVAMTFCGALVVLAGLLFFRKSIRENGVPYAVPISLAFLLTYPVSHCFVNFLGQHK